ncbi:AfsR/SARP family transcriptional regulator [Nocardia cerradoensis]|uniref:Regulatory protein AfsR n=1 Tax=Nocardia cerradoensis TaxID=85688 RepID=A0A231GZI3_9NOCA|nr:AfsR/SARP family transcriptional regulator [Nocardia cerradoensis]NKY48494.1 AfsR/SARP family transcriptional regulator [Nocardia cerradoensis]OXR41962.1 Regulatory protein AfsR [Nocardia cerradoensis]
MSNPVYARVLGPLTLALDNRNATPTAQKQRQLLALLLIRHSTVVPVTTLIEELWNDDPPRSAITVVQTYVLGIRKKMAQYLEVDQGEIADRYLRTWSKGYMFDAQDCVLDLRDYRTMTDAARCALNAGDDVRAVDLFTAAEALWTGPALLDVECGLPLSAELSHLEQVRLTDLELRIEAQLRLGRHREVCPDLARLTAEQPLHERLQAYYMYALCRSGRRHRALESYHEFARSLQRELGLDPCVKLRRLHSDILNASDESVTLMLESRHAGYLIGWQAGAQRSATPA